MINSFKWSFGLSQNKTSGLRQRQDTDPWSLGYLFQTYSNMNSSWTLAQQTSFLGEKLKQLLTKCTLAKCICDDDDDEVLTCHLKI